MGVLVLAALALLLLGVAATGQGSARPARRFAGAWFAALGSWVLAAIFTAWSPVGIPLAIGVVAGAVQARRRSVTWRRGVDLAVVVASALASVPPPALGAGLGAALALLVAGSALDFAMGRAPWRVVRAVALAPVVIAVAGLVLTVHAGRLPSLARALTRARFDLAITWVGEGPPLRLPTGAVAWSDGLAAKGGATGALFFHGADPAGAQQPAALVVRRALRHAGYAVLAVDHPGYGASPSPALEAPLEAWDPLPTEQAALSEMIARGFTRLLVVGHSLGNRGTLRLAAASPEHVERAVLCGAEARDPGESVDYWHERFHRDRRLPARMPEEKFLAINRAYYDTREIARALPIGHPPILFLRFRDEHDDIRATRDVLYDSIPGRKEAWELASNHYFDSYRAAGILVGNVRVARAFAARLRRLRDEPLGDVPATSGAAATRAGPEPAPTPAGPPPVVPRFGVYEGRFAAAGNGPGEYSSVAAVADVRREDGAARLVPLFWDGDSTWVVRFSPEEEGEWTLRLDSSDPSLDGRTVTFRCEGTAGRGGVRRSVARPHLLETRDGTPFWLFGETLWAAFGTMPREHLGRASLYTCIERRASQGFNWVQTSLLGPGENEGGKAFLESGGRVPNPAYFREVDARVRAMNARGMTVLLTLAWGKDEWGFDWEGFPSDSSRLRFARYAVARYSALDVAFCLAGEWDELGDRDLFRRMGALVVASDPHDRPVTIHGTASVEDFAEERWMSFGDYQQIYEKLHEAMLRPRRYGKPVVNAEYAYFLRDQDGDGKVDKPNSASVDEIRHATWDIAMAGGYFVTGWGTTYLGGRRDPGPFAPEDPRNLPWEEQVRIVHDVFMSLEWWKLRPADELVFGEGRSYCLAEPGRQLLVYVRGAPPGAVLRTDEGAAELAGVRIDPRTGSESAVAAGESLRVPDERDWVWILGERGGPG